MELEYALLREFDRVVGRCDQPRSNLNNNEEHGSMTLSIAGGFAEAGSDVKNQNPEVAKEGGSSFFPPHEQVQGNMYKGVPQFLSKVYEIVDDPGTDYVVQWGFGGQSFVVGDAAIFCSAVLPKYFKHSNFSSFIRQLNIYGFRKIDPDKWEFAAEEFQRGKRHRLKYIKRRRSENRTGLGSSGKKEDEALQKAMSAQISNLSQQVEVSNSLISALEKRVQLMACLWSKTIQNPGFIAELIQRKASVQSKSKHGGETSSEEKMENNTILPNCIVTAQTPNQTETRVSVCMSAPSYGESSCSQTEPQRSAVEVVLDPLERLHNELMKESEACEGMASEKCMYYFHELESLITVDESDGDWVAFMATQPNDRKP